MRSLVAFVALIALANGVLAISPVPRKSPDFTVVEVSGKQTPLSSLKGKVVMIEFLLTNCPHCQRVSQTINRLHKELGPRGFHPMGVAFNTDVSERMVTDYVQRFAVTYPVGYSSPQAVDTYLGRSAMERLMVPQIVVIDRQGVIRAQGGPKGDPNLEDENYLRTLIESLLRE